jgi:hypothetical protein
MSRKTAARFETHLRRLRKYLAAAQRISVKVHLVPNLKKKTGDTSWCTKKTVKRGRPKSFKIEIDSGVCEDTKCYLLMHEWAHALSFDAQRLLRVDDNFNPVYKDLEDHSYEWGIAFALCYRVGAEGQKR